MHWGVKTPQYLMHRRVETPQGPKQRGVTEVDTLKNPKWSYALGSHDTQTKFSQIVDNYVIYNLWKFQIDSFKRSKMQKNSSAFWTILGLNFDAIFRIFDR